MSLPDCRHTEACRAKTDKKLCNPCSIARIARDPEARRKSSATMRALHADPEVKERHRAGICRANEERRKDPAWLEAKRESGRQLYLNHASRPEVRAKAHAPEVRRRSGRQYTEKMLGWCPLEYRDLYRKLQRSKHPAAEARAIVEQQIAADLLRYQRTGKLQATAASTHSVSAKENAHG